MCHTIIPYPIYQPHLSIRGIKRADAGKGSARIQLPITATMMQRNTLAMHVHGIPVNVLPARESRNTKGVFYFEANLSDDESCARVVFC